MPLLDEFASISLEVIQEFVAAGREEDLHLDFKVVGDPSLSREDRKSLAVALSGFANSDGGIVVWGVEARPNGNGVDCAVALREIAQASLCLTRLNTLTGQCVSPLVDAFNIAPSSEMELPASASRSYRPATLALTWQRLERTDISREVEAASIGWSISTLKTCSGAGNDHPFHLT